MHKILVAIFLLFNVVNSWATELLEPVKLSDKKISELLIGSWVVPAGVIDYRKTGAVEIYAKDGTNTAIRYKGHDCLVPIRKLIAKWKIEKGKLIIWEIKNEKGTLVKPGYVVTDRVLKISVNKVTLQSERDKQIFSRVKSNDCPK